MKTIEDFNFEDKKALIRVDFNVPLDDEQNVTDTSRIVGAKPTILKVLEDVEPVTQSGLVELPNNQGRVWNHNKEGTDITVSENSQTRLVEEKPAPTILKTKKAVRHYSKDRLITNRETALLQSFPMNFRFAGSSKDMYEMIGNAVPVNLACAVARSLLAAIKESREKREQERIRNDG